MKWLLAILFILFVTDAVEAQQPLLDDTAKVEVRDFNNASLNKYKDDPDFQYEVSAERPRSWWQRFWSSFWRKITSTLGTRNGITITKYVVITIAVIILVLFVIVFLGMGKDGLFGKKNQGDPLDYSVSEDDIHSISFDMAIEEAITNGNLRLAVRLLYLQTLKHLTDAGIINWQLNKTNIAYLNELQGKSYQNNFRRLTLQFESNWYGDLPIGAEEFQSVRIQFNKFNQELS